MVIYYFVVNLFIIKKIITLRLLILNNLYENRNQYEGWVIFIYCKELFRILEIGFIITTANNSKWVTRINFYSNFTINSYEYTASSS